MTFKELLDNILLDIDETATDTLLVSKLKNYINRGYRELAKREKLEKYQTKTVTNNKITLPSECIKLLKVSQDGANIPFLLEGKSVIVNTDGVIKIGYEYLPESLANDLDIPETNTANDEFIINFVKWLYYLAEGLEEEAKVFKLEYENYTIKKSINNIENIIDLYGVGSNVSD